MRRFSHQCDHCARTYSRYYMKDERVPDRIKCECGKMASRVWLSPGTAPLTGWPLYCESVGVMPDQIPEARRADTVNGVPCDFTPDGRRIFNDRAHMRDWMKANGYHNRDGGYGDG